MANPPARTVRFTVNGMPATVEVEPRLTLADCLRHALELTGTHVGCEHGVCGACTVIVDGRAVRSCLLVPQQSCSACSLCLLGPKGTGSGRCSSRPL